MPSTVTSLGHALRRMTGRDPQQPHRAATPLELLFDLAFVASFGIAGNQMAHLLAEGHIGSALIAFSFAMLAIVWAWINFTWFASAFDTDDWFYRVTTMVQMVGVIILALGLPDVFHSIDAGEGVNNGVMVAGYVVMRVALIVQWLRLARQSPEHRRSALFYVVFVSIAQVGWVAMAMADLALTGTFAFALVLYAIEFGGPYIVETRIGATPWHPHHIAERYGLLTIIALGEGVLGTIAAVEPITSEHGWTSDAIVLVTAGSVLTFGLWWTYFNVPFAEVLARRPRMSFVYGYGHLPLFAAIAAIGAGLHVAAYVVEGSAHVGYAEAVQAVAIPVAVFMTGLFVIYAIMVGTLDVFHLLLFVGVVVALAAAVAMAYAGVPFGVCVMIAALAPAVVVIGYETVGHRHAADHLAQL